MSQVCEAANQIVRLPAVLARDGDSFTLLQVSKNEELLHGIKLEPVPAMSTTDRSCAEDRTNIPH